MLAPRMCAALFALIPLFGQTGEGLSERISKAPLTATERQALTTAWSQKQYQQMESVLIRAAQTAQPKDRAAELCALLGALEFLNDRMQQAVQGFRQADALGPLQDPDRFTLAMALIEIGHEKAARVEMTRLYEKDPKQPVYLYWLGRMDYDQRLFEEARDKFKRVVAMDPNSARAYDNLGLTCDMLGRADEALAAFTTSTDLNRKLPHPSPWPPDNMGYFQFRQQKYAEAETNLREALKIDPKFGLAHYHLGRVLENRNQNDAAIEEYEAAAALDSKLAEPLYSLGVLYRRTGHEDESTKALAEYRKRKASTSESR